MNEVRIIGGGIAGLSLGIALAKRGAPVSVHEAGHYPRHKVCGEFISGPGQEVIERLELEALVVKAGAILARTGAFFLESISSPPREFSRPALCISRFALDAALASEFVARGGTLKTGTRVPSPGEQEGDVVATGRVCRPLERGWKWFGLKAHASGVTLDADLEVHRVPAGYVGVCRLADGMVNVCGLFRRQPSCSGPALGWRHELMGPPGLALHDRLAKASFDTGSFRAVAGLSFGLADRGPTVCALGDRYAMIPPVTGNGMSMALESAWLATEPLLAYSRGECSWAEARVSVSHRLNAAFEGRLFWGGLLHRSLMALPRPGAALLLRSDFIWDFLFTRTRSSGLQQTLQPAPCGPSSAADHTSLSLWERDQG